MRYLIFATFAILLAAPVLARSAEIQSTAGGDPNLATMRPHSCVPWYPDAARKVNASGTTTMHFIIGVDGNISQPAVVNSSGNTDLDNAALACVAHWHYKPATKDGVPIAVPWDAKIEWNPTKSERPNSCAEFYAGPPVSLSGIDGTTRVKAEVVRGIISRVTIESSSGNRDLDLAALQCVSTWPIGKGTYKATAKVPWKELLATDKQQSNEMGGEP